MSFVGFLDGVRDEFEGVCRCLLERVARDYGLDSQELVGRYIVADLHEYKFTLGPASPVTQGMLDALPRIKEQSQSPSSNGGVQSPASNGAAVNSVSRRGRKPGPGINSLDLSNKLTHDQLRVLTIPTLKDVCRHRGIRLTGSKPELIDRILSHQENPDAPGAHKKKGGRRKVEKQPEPVHNHAMDSSSHPECEACSHGNPLSSETQEFEVRVQSQMSNDGVQSQMSNGGVQSQMSNGTAVNSTTVPPPVSDSALDAICSNSSVQSPVSSVKSDAEILQDKLQGILAGLGSDCDEPEEMDDDVLSYESESESDEEN